MKTKIFSYLKLLLLIVLSWYLGDGVYFELLHGGSNTGFYLFFNLPMGLLLLFLSINIFIKAPVWQKAFAIGGMIVAVFVFLPPSILHLFR
jgi:hypothetical protein